MSVLLKQLYSEHYKKLVFHVFKGTGNIEDAQDIVQNVVTRILVKIRKNPEKFNFMEHWEFMAYVYRALDNAVIDYYRKNDTDKRRVQDLINEHVVNTTISKSAEDIVMRKEKSKELRNIFMEQLSDEEFLLLRDAYYYRIPIRVLAEEFGIREDAMKKRLSRLKARLRKEMEGKRWKI